jgi:type IV secretory pathway VirB9-like protein
MRKILAAALILAVTALASGSYANDMLDAEKKANAAVVEAAMKAEGDKKTAEKKAAETKAASELKDAEKKANANTQKVETNCPPDNPSNAQAAEKSVILPNAGGSEQSAAPTVQRDGKAVVVDPRCGPDPKQAN